MSCNTCNIKSSKDNPEYLTNTSLTRSLWSTFEIFRTLFCLLMKWWMHSIDQSEKSEVVKVCFGEHYHKKELYLAISRNKVLQCDIVKKVFVRYPGSSLRILSFSSLLKFHLVSCNSKSTTSYEGCSFVCSS